MKSLILITGLLTTQNLWATTTKDLAIECGGQYKVLSSTPVIDTDNTPRRVIPMHHTSDVIEVLNVAGKDCDSLPKHYGVKITAGEKIKIGLFSSHVASEVIQKSQNFPGQVFEFKAQQMFDYTKKGELPYFPTIHKEFVQVLGKTGQVNAKLKYGVPDFTELSDSVKLELSNKVLSEQLDYGKIFSQDFGSSRGSSFLDLYFSLKPADTTLAKEYAVELVWLFKNAQSKYGGSFTSFSVGVQIGNMVNKTLNQLGGTKWQSKVDVFMKNPNLFQEQIVQWAALSEINKVDAPLLTPAEFAEFTKYALELCEKLVPVKNQVVEAAVLLHAYQHAAKSILHQTKNPHSSLGYKPDAATVADLEKIMHL